MSERFTPYEAEPPPETRPTKEQTALSAETEKRIAHGPETPGGTQQAMEGGGLYYTYSDGQGGLVTPEMTEKHRSPENQIEREPGTYRAVPVDPAQANDPPAAKSDAPAPTTPPPDPKDPQTAKGDAPALTAEDEALLRWMQEERARLDAEVKADAAALPEKFRPQARTLSDSGQRAMQGQSPSADHKE